MVLGFLWRRGNDAATAGERQVQRRLCFTFTRLSHHVHLPTSCLKIFHGSFTSSRPQGWISRRPELPPAKQRHGRRQWRWPPDHSRNSLAASLNNGFMVAGHIVKRTAPSVIACQSTICGLKRHKTRSRPTGQRERACSGTQKFRWHGC